MHNDLRDNAVPNPDTGGWRDDRVTTRFRSPEIWIVFAVHVFVPVNLLFVAYQNYALFIPFYAATCFMLVAKVVYGNGFLHGLFGKTVLRRLGNVFANARASNSIDGR
ncbi:MAG TPA: hypothetical protein VIF83_14210 [Gemmatimonadaceae bacterium]